MIIYYKHIIAMVVGFLLIIFALFGKGYNLITNDITQICFIAGMTLFGIGGLITVLEVVKKCISANNTEPNYVNHSITDTFYW